MEGEETAATPKQQILDKDENKFQNINRERERIYHDGIQETDFAVCF